MNEDFSIRLKMARNRVGFKAKELAAKCQVSASYISELESGKRVNPSARLVDDLARELGVETDWLTGANNDPLPPMAYPMPDEIIGTFPLKARAPRTPQYCSVPPDCDLPGRLAALEKITGATADEISSMQVKLDTLCNLLGQRLLRGADSMEKPRAG